MVQDEHPGVEVEGPASENWGRTGARDEEADGGRVAERRRAAEGEERLAVASKSAAKRGEGCRVGAVAGATGRGGNNSLNSFCLSSRSDPLRGV